MKPGKDEKQDNQSVIVRNFHIERMEADDDGETVYRASLSSESPIRDFPWEPPHILLHNKKAVDLDGVSDRGLPLLESHDRWSIDKIIGRIINIRLDKKRLVGDLRFSKANPAAQQIREMVDEGTITDMSIGARINATRRIEEDGQVQQVEVTSWTPIEASVVTIGGDSAVGIGRSRKAAEADTMKEGNNQSAENSADETKDDDGKVLQRIEASRNQHDGETAQKLEESRVKAIRQFGEANSVGDNVVQMWIERGTSLEQVADDIIAIHEKRSQSQSSKSAIGLSDRETKDYSICRAIIAAHSGDWRNAQFELECSEEVARQNNKLPDKGVFFVPLEVQRRQMPVNQQALMQRHGVGHTLQRDLNVATVGEGGYLTQTVNMGFDELLRNISFAFRMGARRLSGLRDNVSIPRQTAAATAAWLATEATGATESTQGFTQLTLSPKTVAAYTELSRQFLLQATVDAEGMVNQDLAAVAALAVDAAVLNGSGAAGEPEGLDNVTGVGAVVGTALGFAGALEFQEDVAAANVMPEAGGYVTTPSVASLMIQRVKYTGTASPIWNGNIWEGEMQGFRAMSTNQVAAATMYFGDWAKALIAEWGVLEIDTNPYANFAAGIVGVRAMYSVDVGIRLPAAFSKADTIT